MERAAALTRPNRTERAHVLPVRRLSVSARYGNLTDEELMTRCRDGESQALEVLFRRFKHPIYNFCLRFLRDPGRAEDVLQETFLRLFASRESWESNARFSSWVYRIARNLCVDEVRRYWNRQVFPESQMSLSGEENSDFLDSRPGRSDDPRESLDREALGRLIAEAIDQLSEEQREVTILHKYQDLSYPEIAEILGISSESVKQRAYRAHLRLREVLEPLLLRK